MGLRDRIAGLTHKTAGHAGDRDTTGNQGASADAAKDLAQYKYLVRVASAGVLEEVHREAFAALAPEARERLLLRLRHDLSEETRPRTSEPDELARAAVVAHHGDQGYLVRMLRRPGHGVSEGRYATEGRRTLRWPALRRVGARPGSRSGCRVGQRHASAGRFRQLARGGPAQRGSARPSRGCARKWRLARRRRRLERHGRWWRRRRYVNRVSQAMVRPLGRRDASPQTRTSAVAVHAPCGSLLKVRKPWPAWEYGRAGSGGR